MEECGWRRADGYPPSNLLLPPSTPRLRHLRLPRSGAAAEDRWGEGRRSGWRRGTLRCSAQPSTSWMNANAPQERPTVTF